MKTIKCLDCGYEFKSISWLASLFICVDPAPNIGHFLRKRKCPECNSSNLKTV